MGKLLGKSKRTAPAARKPLSGKGIGARMFDLN
jgi:hypothetical protein